LLYLLTEVEEVKKGGRSVNATVGHRAYRVTLRFSESEYQQLQENAENAGVTLSTFIRACLQGKRVAGKPAPVPAINREAWAALAKSASNLNQLTKAANEGRNLEVDINALRIMYREIQTLRQQLLGITNDPKHQ
jgi:hypothetical protein